MMLLRALSMAQINSAMLDKTGDSDHYLLYWLSINAHNWPELLRRYAELYVSQPLDPVAAAQGYDTLLPQARRTAETLASEEYYSLPPLTKVSILRFLTDALYCRGEETASNGIGPIIAMRMADLESRTIEEDGKCSSCAICGDGGDLLCCDGCCCSFHVGPQQPAPGTGTAEPAPGCAQNADGTSMAMPPEEDKEREWYCGYCSVRGARFVLKLLELRV